MVFGNRVVVRSGSVADPDLPRDGCLDVNGVVTDAAVRDDFQGCSAGQHVGGDGFAGEDRAGDAVKQ
jgi:hypothetical protein